MVSCTLRPIHEARHVTHHRVNQAASQNTEDQCGSEEQSG